MISIPRLSEFDWLSIQDNLPNSDEFIANDNIILIEKLNYKHFHEYEVPAVKLKTTLLVFYCTNGEACFHINEKEYTITPGTIFIGLPNVLYDRKTSSSDFEGSAMLISAQISGELVNLSHGILDFAFAVQKNPILTTSKSDRIAMANYFSLLKFLLIRSKTQDIKFSKEILDSVLKAVLFELISKMTEKPLESTPTKSATLKQGDILFKNFLMLLFANGGKNRTVSYYADLLFVSPKYLSSVSKKITGKTALEIIHEETFKIIKQDLLYSEKSIKEIANKYDFPNISFFGKFFKQHMGISPRQYRNKNKK